ncbi:MAG: hypothetical protein KGL39_45770 [Patescibacteria group bacterium]|nr:hypothetical protein [Patescibacteria group bacterium]
MQRQEAENLIEHLTQCGFNAALSYESWPDGYESWSVMVETREGHLYHLLTPEAVAHFIEHDGPPELKEDTAHMRRYLKCKVCQARFSANPEHYVGWAGYLSHCGKAIEMWQRNPVDNAEYRVSELVDWDYLRNPHADHFDLHSPLQFHASQKYVGIAKEETMGTPVRPPKIPEALRQPVDEVDPRMIGFALYEAGYRRLYDGQWRRTFDTLLNAAEHYHPFEEGDRILYETDHSIPFTALQTHRSPNYWGIRFQQDRAA